MYARLASAYALPERLLFGRFVRHCSGRMLPPLGLLLRSGRRCGIFSDPTACRVGLALFRSHLVAVLSRRPAQQWAAVPQHLLLLTGSLTCFVRSRPLWHRRDFVKPW